VPRSVRNQQLITIQSTSFFNVIFSCLERAFPVYRKNLSRPPVADRENIECSAALLILVTALESHVNRLMYFDSKGLSTADALLRKLQKFLPQRQNASLLRQIEEVTVCRDAIVHSHVWVVTRRYDTNGNIAKQTYKPAGITKFRQKLERNRLKSLPVSKRLRLNLIPTNVDFVDLAKSLVVALHLRKLEKKYGNPIAYVSPFPYEPRAAKTFLLSISDNTWEGWIGGMIRLLHPCHRKEVEHRFRFKIAPHTSSLVKAGLLTRGHSYTLPRGGPTIDVRS
jgi:hypothetical protein